MSQPAKPPRHKRPAESHFVGKTLADKWDGLASRRKVSFAWDGSGYMSTRTQNIDEMTMLPYAEPLKALLEVAPSGFPSHKCLMEAFEELHTRYEVLSCDKRFVLRAATLAAENWKIMTEHLYNVALLDKKLNNEKLQELVKLIRLPDNEDSPSAAVNVAAAAALPALPEGTRWADVPVDGEAADAPESGGRVDMDKSRTWRASQTERGMRATGVRTPTNPTRSWRWSPRRRSPPKKATPKKKGRLGSEPLLKRICSSWSSAACCAIAQRAKRTAKRPPSRSSPATPKMS